MSLTMSSWHSDPPSPIPRGVIPAVSAPRSAKTRGPSGLAYTWRLWRHCCCRYGWYPLIVAPIVTAGCLMSLYSSTGCDFLRVNIGFTPSNDGWNRSSAQFGLFLYQSEELEINKYRETFVDGCRWYPDEFAEEFIEGDRTWKVARIMSYISGISGIIGTVTAWLFVVSPLPASFFWPGILLPSLMAAFLAEGSKFLIFDVSLCRNTVWFPSGDDSLPRVADECSLGSTSYFAIASGAVFFVALLLVCFKAPDKRILESDYGTRFTDLDHGESDSENPHNFGRPLASIDERDLYSEDPNYGLSLRSESVRDDRSEMQSTIESRQTSREGSDYRYSADDPVDHGDSFNGHLSGEFAKETLASERLKSLDGLDDTNTTDHNNEVSGYDERYNPKKPAGADLEEEASVSESRLHAAERLELNANTESELIDKFVNEVNDSFVRAEQKEEAAATDEVGETEEKQKREITLETSTVCGTSLCVPSSARSY